MTVVDPLTVLRETLIEWGSHLHQYRRREDALDALTAVEQLVEAARHACQFAYEMANDQETDAMDDLDAALARFEGGSKQEDRR